MPTKIRLVSGEIKISATPYIKKKQLIYFVIIKFQEIVCKGDTEAELIENFVFERIRNGHQSTIQKGLKENKLKITKIEVVKELGHANLE